MVVQQCVPVDASLHRLKEFRRFLEVRRELLATAVNVFLNRAS